MADQLSVVCFLWHDERAKARHVYTYGPAHVKTLKQMVQKNLHVPYEFVCVTDQPDKITFCRTVTLDRTTFIPGTRFAKLMLFRRDMGDLIGSRMLYLDLDCVVTGKLDPIVKRDEPLVLWRNPNFGGKRRARYNTSFMLIQAGCRPALYESFDPAVHPLQLREMWGGTDQAWISQECSPEEAFVNESYGVYGAGRLRDIVPGVGTELPANARIVFFPGSRIPQMPAIQERHPWIKQYLP